MVNSTPSRISSYDPKVFKARFCGPTFPVNRFPDEPVLDNTQLFKLVGTPQENQSEAETENYSFCRRILDVVYVVWTILRR